MRKTAAKSVVQLLPRPDAGQVFRKFSQVTVQKNFEEKKKYIVKFSIQVIYRPDAGQVFSKVACTDTSNCIENFPIYFYYIANIIGC